MLQYQATINISINYDSEKDSIMKEQIKKALDSIDKDLRLFNGFFLHSRVLADYFYLHYVEAIVHIAPISRNNEQKYVLEDDYFLNCVEKEFCTQLDNALFEKYGKNFSTIKKESTGRM